MDTRTGSYYFSLSLSWIVERKILIPPLHLGNSEPSSLTLFQKRTGHRTDPKENYNRTGVPSNRILYCREGGGLRLTPQEPLSDITYYSKQKLCGIHNTDLNTDSNCMTVSAVCRTLIQYALCINLPPVFWRGRRCVSEIGPEKRQISMYRENSCFPWSYLTLSLYCNAIFYLNFWPVYTFGVHWVAECGGGNQAIFLSLWAELSREKS